jgi:hypothetical protein
MTARCSIGTPVQVGDYLLIPDFLAPNYHGLLAELQQESLALQPWQPNEFSQHSAALHEAAHCVVAAREGYALKSARIFRGPTGTWLGDFWIDWPEKMMTVDTQTPEFLANLRIYLAGRRGELLFLHDRFCLRAGLDELAYALLMIMPCLVAQTDGDGEAANELYASAWETTLAEIDETLFAHRQIVKSIADRLIRKGSLRSHKLAQLVAPVLPRTEQPRIRAAHEVRAVFDPLAYSPAY